MKLVTVGPVDLHFHGAFGVDLMSSPVSTFRDLSVALWKKGVAGFCPTTLSAPAGTLSETVKRLGHWIRSENFPGAIPLGIHLEGPFISPTACGAHPSHSIRKLNWNELEHLWTVSQQTIKIVTIAPELLKPAEIKQLVQWCRSRQIHLSLGHSTITEDAARQAFKMGFQGLTHAWNALPFHQRAPGAMGAALGNPHVYLELILDGIHVSPTVIRWTLDLHPQRQVCFVSDCLSAGGFSKKNPKSYPFGALQIRFEKGACRLLNGHLAGGGKMLTEMYCQWVQKEATHRNVSSSKVFKSTVNYLTSNPLKLLGLSSSSLRNRRVLWSISTSGPLCVIPIDSTSTSR